MSITERASDPAPATGDGEWSPACSDVDRAIDLPIKRAGLAMTIR
ncbi:hypothetical protein [Sphingomonas sp. TF3]|nr:hypothetical protein [Sphingomonas sp. TF3]